MDDKKVIDMLAIIGVGIIVVSLGGVMLGTTVRWLVDLFSKGC